MLYYNANPRDGADAVSACQTCCCETVKMRPGETNLLTINYAQWSVPIGWLAQSLDYAIEVNSTACPTNAINGAVPPTNTLYIAVTPANTAVVVDLSPNALPVSLLHLYEIVPMSGPYNGTVDLVGTNVTYTPTNGFRGFDNFWYKMTDAEGRSRIYSVVIDVASALGAPPRAWIVTKPYIDLTKVKINEATHTVSFPIHMPLSCQACEVYRMTVKQPARDCDGNIFWHFKCLDFRCGGC